MSHLQHWQQKIQEKRKQTPRREFVMEISSWTPLNLYKKNGSITCYSDPLRSGPLIDIKSYYEQYSDIIEDNIRLGGSFLASVSSLFQSRHKSRVVQFAQNENVDYANFVFGAKNAYLSFIVGDDCENVLYSAMIYYHCTNVYNSIMVSNYSENIFDSTYVTHSYNIFYSYNIHNSNNIRNSSNLVGCSECIGCSNLENQSYCIDNISYPKEEYLSLKQQQNHKHKLSHSLHEGSNFISNNSQGSGLYHCDSVSNGLMSSQLKDAKNAICIGGGESSSSFYDVFEAGVNSHHFYGVGNSGTFSEHIYCSIGVSQRSSNIYYSYHIDNCSFCLGCIGLKNKSYCILNKQYTKEEWYEKVDEIFAQMEVDGTLGQFFPANMNPFYFNDTAAYLIDPSFTKEEVIAAGYLWRDEPIKVDIPEGAITITTQELSQFESRDQHGNRNIDDTVCKRVIIDEQGNAYRIIPMELEFLRKHGLPLPRKHWLDRMKENFSIN